MMAAKPDGISANLAGMSKNQLYNIMSQMKALIEQNQQQARQILIQNPVLTKALFQAQIMLGMVQPPQSIPNIQATASQQVPQLVQPVQQPNIQAAQALPGQSGSQDQSHQTVSSQAPTLIRKQQQIPPMMPTSSTTFPPPALQSPSLPMHPLQTVQQPKGHLSSQTTQMPYPQSSQVSTLPSIPLHSVSQPPPLQPPMPSGATQLQQPLQTGGFPHTPLQPPLPPQPRPQPTMTAFSHQLHSQMGPSVSFPHSGAPQMHHLQPVYHSSIKPPPSMGPSFSHGQLPSQSPYQVGGSRMGNEFSSQLGVSIQQERGPAWMQGMPENAMPTQLQGPLTLGPGQMGQSSQHPRPQPLTPEMEKALLQQVMSLTPEQINLLPPEQRNQVLQLQQMLRQ